MTGRVRLTLGLARSEGQRGGDAGGETEGEVDPRYDLRCSIPSSVIDRRSETRKELGMLMQLTIICERVCPDRVIDV